MSTPFDRFAAREDRLSALLQLISPYEPPASLQSEFTARARQAQAGFTASAIFEPPANLATDFHKLAGQLDAAQQERKAAVLREIAAGTPVDQVLGASVSPASEDWLRQRAREDAGKPMETARKPVTKHFWLSWRDIQLVSLATILTAWATHHYLQQRPDHMADAMLEVFRQVGAAHQLMMPEDTPSVASADTTPESAPQTDKALPATPGEASRPSRPPAQTETVAASRSPAPIVSTPGRQARKSITPATPEAIAPAQIQAPAQPASALAPAPVKQAAMETPPVPVAAVPTLRLHAMPAPSSTPSGKQGMEPPMVSMPAPAATTQQTETSFSATIADNPAMIAGRLGESPLAGVTIFSSTPSAPAVEAWVDKLRKALQERHPDIAITMRPDAALAPDVLRITTAPQ